jgi:hypothetical protein
MRAGDVEMSPGHTIRKENRVDKAVMLIVTTVDHTIVLTIVTRQR